MPKSSPCFKAGMCTIPPKEKVLMAAWLSHVDMCIPGPSGIYAPLLINKEYLHQVGHGWDFFRDTKTGRFWLGFFGMILVRTSNSSMENDHQFNFGGVPHFMPILTKNSWRSSNICWNMVKFPRAPGHIFWPSVDVVFPLRSCWIEGGIFFAIVQL